jgi:predicted RNase H-like HicB family nuclease
LRLRHRLALVAQQFDWRRSTAVERESNGTFSAWVAGLPGVYAAADTAGVAKRGIRRALAAHLDALASAGRSPHRLMSSSCGTTRPHARAVPVCGSSGWGPCSVAVAAPRRPRRPDRMAERAAGHFVR